MQNNVYLDNIPFIKKEPIISNLCHLSGQAEIRFACICKERHIMTIIAIDIQPQYRFSCMAANEQRFLQRPESIVDGLNRQAEYADKRLLIENVSADQDALCNLCNNSIAEQGGFILNRSAYFGACANGCRSKFLLSGLPHPADYDHAVEIDGDYRHGVCFHDKKETRSTGLIEWLYAQNADTVILGGLATEDTVAATAKQLTWYNNDIRIIVNLSACCGYSPESTIRTVYSLREMGISVVTDAKAIPALLDEIPSQLMFKVS